ncbi:MAG: hypothetical protein Ct9H300mP19_05280 [Dehalococcoidia bacterium]|nr:MAG: hypothetical protein Ct9H300mP19_05280 [Dehalococcoidia bacterium]
MAASTNLFVSVLGSVAGSWPAILQNRIVFGVCDRDWYSSYSWIFYGWYLRGLGFENDSLLIVALLLVWSSLMMIVRAVAELRNRSLSEKMVMLALGVEILIPRRGPGKIFLVSVLA